MPQVVRSGHVVCGEGGSRSQRSGGRGRRGRDLTREAQGRSRCSAICKFPRDPMVRGVGRLGGDCRSGRRRRWLGLGGRCRLEQGGNPTDPPTVDEIVAVMRQAGDDRHGRRMRGLIVHLWRPARQNGRSCRSRSVSLNEERAYASLLPTVSIRFTRRRRSCRLARGRRWWRRRRGVRGVLLAGRLRSLAGWRERPCRRLSRSRVGWLAGRGRSRGG